MLTRHWHLCARTGSLNAYELKVQIDVFNVVNRTLVKSKPIQLMDVRALVTNDTFVKTGWDLLTGMQGKLSMCTEERRQKGKVFSNLNRVFLGSGARRWENRIAVERYLRFRLKKGVGVVRIVCPSFVV